MNETRQPKAIEGYEVIARSDAPCAYCDGHDEGPVYLMQALFKGVGREPLHEHCAGYWFEFYRRINKRDDRGQV